MPGASAPAAARVVVVNTRVSHHGYAETPGIPARNGFNGLLRALLGDQDLLVTVAGGFNSADLKPTSRRSGPHGFAVRRRHARLAHRPRPPHPAPTSVTFAKRPSKWGGTRFI